MINFSLLISSSEVEGPGGLFDINATLPLVAIQFILLMVLLNVILYSPLLTIIEERKEYVLSNLAEASEKLAQAKELNAQYEQDLETERKAAQLEIANSQNFHKKILDIQLDISQKTIDIFIKAITKDVEKNRQEILKAILDPYAVNGPTAEHPFQNLCFEIEQKLSM
jgi:F-type H+-transporting ATPase subunit b